MLRKEVVVAVLVNNEGVTTVIPVLAVVIAILAVLVVVVLK